MKSHVNVSGKDSLMRRSTWMTSIQAAFTRIATAWTLAVVLIISSYGSAVAIGSPSKSEVRELADTFGALPLLRSLSVSPGGEWIAAIGVVDKRAAIVVAPFGTQRFEPVAMLKNSYDRIDWVAWANNDRLVFSSSSPTIQRGRVYREPAMGSVNVDGTGYVELENDALYVKSARSGRMMGLVHNLPEDSDHILVSAYDYRERGASIFKVDVYTSDFIKKFSPSEEIESASPNEAGELLYGSTVDDLTASLFYRASEDAGFEKIYEFSLEDGQGGFGIIGPSDNPETLYVLTNLETDKTVLAEFDLAANELVGIVFEDPRYDVSNALYWNGKLQSLAVVRETPQYEMKSIGFSLALEKAEKALGKSDLRFVDGTKDLSKVVVAVTAEGVVPEFYALDYTNNKGALIASTYPGAKQVPIAPTQSHWIKARDGEDINVYVTLPESNEKPETKLPLVVFPHGGPNARDVMGFDPFVQYFAAMGYAVLQVNFRGSSGFGRAYEKAGFMQWGKRMQDDVIDAQQWLIDQGRVDGERSCVVGASYGGYVALTASFKTPERFNCYVSIAGVSDIESLLKSEYYAGSELSKEVNAVRHGDTGIDLEYMRQQSLAHNVDSARGPILLVHGTRDTRVKLDQSKSIYGPLKKAKVDVELFVIKNGTHYLDHQANRQKVFREIGEFLAKHI